MTNDLDDLGDLDPPLAGIKCAFIVDPGLVAEGRVTPDRSPPTNTSSSKADPSARAATTAVLVMGLAVV